MRAKKSKEKPLIKDRLKDLNSNAVDCVERAIGEISLEWQKDEIVDTGIVVTGKLRHIIQSIKDLKDIAEKDEQSQGKDTSKLLQALESENDT